VSKFNYRRWDLDLSPEFGAEILERDSRRRKMSIWTILFVILLLAWITGFSVFHVAGGLIHLLLVFAVISLILHFVMGKSTA
jgi:Family of unknown function (DUF5670)